MTDPHIPLVHALARSHGLLKGRSAAEGSRIRQGLKTELDRCSKRLASEADPHAYTALVAQKGRLQDALAGLA